HHRPSGAGPDLAAGRQRAQPVDLTLQRVDLRLLFLDGLDEDGHEIAVVHAQHPIRFVGHLDGFRQDLLHLLRDQPQTHGPAFLVAPAVAHGPQPADLGETVPEVRDVPLQAAVGGLDRADHRPDGKPAVCRSSEILNVAETRVYLTVAFKDESVLPARPEDYGAIRPGVRELYRRRAKINVAPLSLAGMVREPLSTH